MWKVIKTLFGIIYINFNRCLPVSTVQNVSLSEFVRHTWYSQMQQEVAYQSKKSLYCVTATYNIEKNRTVPLFNGNVISVYNYANYDKVNGEPMNPKNGTVLCAKQVIPNTNSKFSVAPCNVIGIFGGPYWIVGIGENYEWLVISGGQPRNEYNDGCTTNINNTNNAGLWILSREPVISKKNMKQAFSLLTYKGYTLSQLIPVAQIGCTYKGAFIK